MQNPYCVVPVTCMGFSFFCCTFLEVACFMRQEFQDYKISQLKQTYSELKNKVLSFRMNSDVFLNKCLQIQLGFSDGVISSLFLFPRVPSMRLFFLIGRSVKSSQL